MTNLEDLMIGGSNPLQLRHGDIQLLQTLLLLERLELSRDRNDVHEESGFSQYSVGVLIELGRALPDVQIDGFSGLSDDD